MLTQMRSGLNSFFVLFLLGLLISSFAIWGIGDVFTSRTSYVAKVGEREIGPEEFMREFQARLQNYQAQFGSEFDTQQAVSLGLHKMILNEMISRTTLDENARVLGLVGAPDTVRTAIKEMEVFKDPNGQFSRFNYEQILASAGLSPKSFENSLLTEHARAQLVETVAAQSPVPSALVDTIYSFRKEKRQAKILNIQTTDITPIAEPDEETLKTYHEQNERFFMTPEYRDVKFLVLEPSHFADEVEFSDEKLKETYEEHFAQYSRPEARDVQVLVLDDEKSAEEVYDRVKAGETLAQVAADKLGYSEADITIGKNEKYNLDTDYNETAAERVFALPVGGITKPTQTLFGWHIFAVTKIYPEEVTTFEQAKAGLIKELSGEAGYDAVYSLVERIDDAIAGGSDMDAIVQETGLTPLILSGIDRNGVDKTGHVAEDTKSVSQFLATAFSANPGDELVINNFGEGGFYLVQVDNVTAPELKPFASVKKEVRQRWYAQESLRQAGILANASLIKAQNGESLETIAKKFKASVIDTGLLQRDQARGNLQIARPIFDLIFSLQDGETGMEKSTTDNGYILVQLTLKSKGIPNATDAEYQALRQSLSAEIGNDFIIQYQKAVQEKLGVEINQDLLNRLFSNDTNAR